MRRSLRSGRGVRRAHFELLEPRELLSASPTEIARALDLPAGVAVSYSGDTQAVQSRVLTTSGGLLGFPSGRDEDFLLLSSGIASQMDTVGNTSGSQGTDLGAYGVSGDTATISFSLNVPSNTQPQKLKFDFIFLSEEYPEYVGSVFNDFFTATVNGTNVAMDQFGNPVSVNNVFFDGGLSTAGTFFDGRTAMLTAAYTIPDGTTTLNIVLSVGDVGDGIYDSGVIVDNVRIEARQQVYLNFEGQNNLSFAGSNTNLPAFQPTDLGYPDNNNRAAVISNLVAAVQADYTGLDVSFTTTRPTSGDYSTVIIGGDDNWMYSGSGTLFGRAQSVDVGNLIASDTAVICSREFGNYFIARGETADQARDRIGTTISHELGHNLGLRHVEDSYGDDTMKKYAPLAGNATFHDELRDLSSLENWPDQANKQNSMDYLRGVLGTPGTNSVLAQAWNWLRRLVNPWFTFSVGNSTIYNVTLGTAGDLGDANGDGIVDGDIAPQVFHFDVLRGAEQIVMPNMTGTDQFFLIGASKPGGTLDITTGGLDAQGNVTIDSALVDFGDQTSLVLQKKDKKGDLRPFTTASLDASEYADVEWLFRNRGVFVDTDGDTYTIRLTGPGAVAVVQDDPDGDGKGPITEIILQDTNPAGSKLFISVRKAKTGDGLVTVGGINGGGLKNVSAKAVDLVAAGLDTDDNFLGGATLHGLFNGAGITAGGTSAQKTRLTLGTVGDDSAITLGSTLTRLITGDFGRATLSVPAVGKMTVKGNFSGKVDLSGPAGQWVLGSMSVKGLTDGATIRSSQGNLGELTFAAISNSGIYAGYDGDALPTSASQLGVDSVIKSIVVEGMKGPNAPATFVANSNVVAKTIRYAGLLLPDVNSGSGPWGLGADLAKKVKITTIADGKKVTQTFRNMTEPADSVDLGNFELRIL